GCRVDSAARSYLRQELLVGGRAKRGKILSATWPGCQSASAQSALLSRSERISAAGGHNDMAANKIEGEYKKRRKVGDAHLWPAICVAAMGVSLRRRVRSRTSRLFGKSAESCSVSSATARTFGCWGPYPRCRESACWSH